MQYNEDNLKKRAKEKADFYYREKLKAHVAINPTGFKNGIFRSELVDDIFYWFFDFKDKKEIRLFLTEIFDIEDYEEEVRKDE